MFQHKCVNLSENMQIVHLRKHASIVSELCVDSAEHHLLAPFALSTIGFPTTGGGSEGLPWRRCATDLCPSCSSSRSIKCESEILIAQDLHVLASLAQNQRNTKGHQGIPFYPLLTCWLRFWSRRTKAHPHLCQPLGSTSRYKCYICIFSNMGKHRLNITLPSVSGVF